MCYSSNDSIIGYLIGTVSSLLLITTKQTDFVVIGYFFLFVTQMQLFDYIFWNNQDCDFINKTATKLAITVNQLQPLVLIGLQLLFGLNISQFSVALVLLYALFALPYTKNALESVKCTLPKNDLLFWEWNTLSSNHIVYALFLASLIVSGFNFSKSWIQWFTAMASIASFFIAHKIPTLNQSVGRIWCYFAAFMPAIYYIIHSLTYA